mmetsp:Transcript_34779/g.63879  ORF Transcript_34779/g.63879 Transcript_34779/m.63879 type:complete len:123 (-) Transcript_34779:396-764(-)
MAARWKGLEPRGWIRWIEEDAVVLVGHFSRKSGTEVWDNGDCISFGSARAVGDCCAADSFLADILQPWSFLADGSVTTVGSCSYSLKQNITIRLDHGINACCFAVKSGCFRWRYLDKECPSN